MPKLLFQGHASCRLTADDGRVLCQRRYVPDEFIQLHNSIPTALRLEQGNPDAPEVFADTFAVAAMRGTELERCDPFNFPEALNEAFEKFYTGLFEKYRRAGTMG